jgi:hypothetical protein
MKREYAFRGILYLGCISVFILNIVQKQLPSLFIFVSTIGVIIFTYMPYWLANTMRKVQLKFAKESEKFKPISRRLYLNVAMSVFLIGGIIEYIANIIANYAFIFALGLSIVSILNDILMVIKQRKLTTAST